MRVGIDLVDVARIERALTLRGPEFADRIFTRQEIAYCESKRDRFQSYAARFAAKEAVAKLLGTGFSCFWPRDIEVIVADGGQPKIALHGGAKAIAESVGVRAVSLSLSHTGATAVAMAAAEEERSR